MSLGEYMQSTFLFANNSIIAVPHDLCISLVSNTENSTGSFSLVNTTELVLLEAKESRSKWRSLEAFGFLQTKVQLDPK